MHVTALLLVLSQAPAPPPLPDPLRIVRDVQAAFDLDGGRIAEREWRAALARRPRDPRAMLGVATIERNRYRYERADSLLLAIEATPGLAAEWQAMARIGRAAWRALGTDIPAADSLFTSARSIARAAARRDVEAEAILGLTAVRSRTQGPRAGRALLDEWWALLASPTPTDSALHLCQGGVFDDQAGDTSGLRRVIAGREVAERRRTWRVAGNCRLAEAQIADRRGYGDAVRGSANVALQVFRRIDYAVGVALASQWYGYALATGGDFARAQPLLEEAIVAARRVRFESVEAWAYTGLAQLHLDLGDLGRARRYAERAAASHERRRDLWGLATASRFEADAMAASGDLTGAVARYRDAQRAFVAARLPSQATPALVARAGLLLRLGQLDSAEAAIAELDQVGRTVDAWRISEAPQLRGVLAMRRGRLAEADSLLRTSFLAARWRRGETTRAPMLAAAREAQLALRRDRMALADSALGVVTTRLEGWRRRPSNEGYTAVLAQLRDNWSGLTEVTPDLVAQLVARQRESDAFAFVEALRAREVVERRLRSVALERDSALVVRALHAQRAEPAVVTAAALGRALAPDEAFVSYVLGVDDAPTTAFVVTRDTLVTHRLPTRTALLPDIRRFSQLAASGTESVAAGRRLGDALLAPVFASLSPAITRVIVSPDGELHRVPFDALRLADDRHAVERAAFSIAPSATSLLALRTSAPSAGGRVVALGDPRYAREGIANGETSSAVERAAFEGVALPRLRGSGDEARRVVRYGARGTLLLGPAATESAVVRSLGRDVGVLHLAAHGLIDETSQFNTALALAPGAEGDGFLTPSELSLLDLHGPLVVLSACRTSAGQVLGGEGLRGVTAPLLEAGARAVVGTHWSIEDRSVVPFVDRFYAAMAAGARPDDALRQVKRAAIAGGVNIADWGSWTVTGDASVAPRLRPSGTTPAPWLRAGAMR